MNLKAQRYKRLFIILFAGISLATASMILKAQEADEEIELVDLDFNPFTDEEESILLPSEPPVDPKTGEPLETTVTLTLPVIGTISLEEVTDPKTKKKELQGKITKEIKTGLLTIKNGTVRILEDNKILFDVNADLLGRPIILSITDWKKAGTLAVVQEGTNKKRSIKLPIESVSFRAAFKDPLKVELIPGTPLVLSHVDLKLSNTKGLEITSNVTIAKQTTNLIFQVNPEKQVTTEFKLEKITLEELASSLSNTPFNDIALSASFKIIGDIFKPQATGQRTLSATFAGDIDLSSLSSSLPFLKSINLKAVSASGALDKNYLQFKAQIGDFTLDPLGTVKAAALEFNTPLKFAVKAPTKIAAETANKAGTAEKETKEAIAAKKVEEIVIESPQALPSAPLLSLTGTGFINVLGQPVDYVLSSDYNPQTGFTLEGYLGKLVPLVAKKSAVTLEEGAGKIPDLVDATTEIALPGGLKLNGAKFRINTLEKTALITGTHNIAGLALLLNLDVNLKDNAQVSLNAQILSKEYYPFRSIPNITIDARLKNIKIKSLKFMGGLKYTKATGLTGNLELKGSAQLGEILGKDEKVLEQSPALKALITTTLKITLGKQFDIVLDVSLEKLPSLKELFPELFKNIAPQQSTEVTNTKGDLVKKTVPVDKDMKDMLFDFIDLFKLNNGLLVISSRTGIVIGKKTYDKGLSISAQVDLDMSNPNNGIVQLVSKIIKLTGKKPGSLELTGNIDPTNLRSTNLMVALGSGDLEAKIGPKAAPATFKAGYFGLKFSGSPSVAITAGFGLIPRPGETPLEFSTAIDFSVYKVGFNSSMKNIWTEPFGVKGFAFGNLGAQWYQDYPTIMAAVSSIPAAATGIGAIATATAWLNALLLPAEVGLTGSVTFMKAAARNRIRQELESGVAQELIVLLEEEEYKDIQEKQKKVLKESIFNAKLYAHECGTRGTHQGPGSSNDYTCARVFFNIGKDLSKLALDVALENPLTLVDLLEFIGEQMGVDTPKLAQIKQTIPFKVRQATLKFAPFGSQIGSIKLDAGLGVSGFIEVLGKESCFVANIDWQNGILIKGKMPKIVSDAITIAGAYCRGNLDKSISCTPEEFAKLEKEFVGSNTVKLDIKSCERSDPGFELKISLKELPKLIISCFVSVGKVISSTTQISMSIKGLDLFLNTKVMNSEVTVHVLTTNKDMANVKLEDLAVEVTLKNSLKDDSPEIVKEITKFLREDINKFLQQQKEELERQKWNTTTCKRLKELQGLLRKP